MPYVLKRGNVHDFKYCPNYCYRIGTINIIERTTNH